MSREEDLPKSENKDRESRKVDGGGDCTPQSALEVDSTSTKSPSLRRTSHSQTRSRRFSRASTTHSSRYPHGSRSLDLNRTHTDVGSALDRHEAIPDVSSLASIDRPPSDAEKLPPTKIYHPLSIHVLTLLMPASIFGVLARLGIQALATYDGRAIFPLAWVQVIGCLVMGFGLGIKEPLGQFYGPLYTALTTGFCGSLTTFSGWQYDIFSSWLNTTQFHRDWLRDVIDGLSKTAFTLGLSLSAIYFGAHLATLARKICPPAILPPPNKYIRYTISLISALTYFATIPLYFRLSPSFRHQATAALLFSFPGTLTRYLLSIYLNPLLELMPLGTFTANMSGTALLGVFHVLQGTSNPVSENACALLQGLEDGYCGCLTTISTFAAEVDALPDKKSWFYVATSWITAQLLLLVILGPSFWAGNIVCHRFQYNLISALRSHYSQDLSSASHLLRHVRKHVSRFKKEPLVALSGLWTLRQDDWVPNDIPWIVAEGFGCSKKRGREVWHRVVKCFDHRQLTDDVLSTSRWPHVFSSVVPLRTRAGGSEHPNEGRTFSGGDK